MSLRHEGYAVGDRIKAFDHQPREGAPDRYIVGTIIEVVAESVGWAHYRVKVEEDTLYSGDTARKIVNVPMEVHFDEWGGRISYAAPTGPTNNTQRLIILGYANEEWSSWR